MFALIVLAGALSASSITLQSDSFGNRYVRVAEAAGGDLVVHVESADKNLPAVLGKVSPMGRDLIFVPRYPFQPGVRYEVSVLSPVRLTKTLRIPELVAQAVTYVEQIYPTSDVLPENLLKLYVCFSAPMARGDAYDAIQLLDQDGKPVAAPFLTLDQELWDPSMQRLTLLFDPGRVKRDLLPNRDVGAPLVPGRSYTLVVATHFHDAGGQRLREEFRKRFRVVAADRIAPDPNTWRIAPPLTPDGFLSVQFPEPMDSALAARMQLRWPKGEVESLTHKLEDGERRILLRAHEREWVPGEYQLIISTSMEDLAGNRIGRLFDVDTTQVDSHVDSGQRVGTTVTRTFVVKNGAGTP